MPVDQLMRLGQVRPIVRWGSPVLHTASHPVTSFGPDLQDLLADLFATNRAAQGAGLAAPQVGAPLAVFVFDCLDADYRRRTGVVCNPVVETLTGRRRELESEDEGCLSLPGASAVLARPGSAVCRGQDQYGAEVQVVGAGQLARCLQHETDHLNGTVFGDRLPGRLRRQLYEEHRRESHRYPDDWPVSPVLE